MQHIRIMVSGKAASAAALTAGVEALAVSAKALGLTVTPSAYTDEEVGAAVQHTRVEITGTFEDRAAAFAARDALTYPVGFALSRTICPVLLLEAYKAAEHAAYVAARFAAVAAKAAQALADLSAVDKITAALAVSKDLDATTKAIVAAIITDSTGDPAEVAK